MQKGCLTFHPINAWTDPAIILPLLYTAEGLGAAIPIDGAA